MTRLPEIPAAWGARVAEAYRSLPVDAYHAGDPRTVRAYDALIRCLPGAYARVLQRFRVVHTAADPYPDSVTMLREMDAGRMRVFLGGDPHPVLGQYVPYEAWTDRAWDLGIQVDLTYNDLFRAVHDCQHFDLRAPFGPQGEDAVYRAHRADFPREAVLAIATETRGQNSVFNFGPNPGNFADQRAAVLPAWAVWGDPDDA